MHLCLEDIMTQKEIEQIKKEQHKNIEKSKKQQDEQYKKPSNDTTNNIDDKLITNFMNINIHR